MSTKRIDRRTARGQRIKEQLRDRIVTAYCNLIRAGIPTPTARETTARAGVSLRVIFNHFADLGALRMAAFERMQAESSALFTKDIPNCGSAAERLESFVEKHTRRLEYVSPLHRTAAMVESVDSQVANAMRKARNAAARDLEKALGPTLSSLSPGEKQSLLMKLHTVCSWPCWEMLRTHYHLSPKRARSLMSSAAVAVLAAAMATAASGSNGKD